jgi:phosphonatase-like hydrolase
MVKMVVFDMAGTTVNEDNVVYKTLQEAVKNAGFEVSLEHVLAYGAGKEKLQAIKDVLTSMSVTEVDTKSVEIFSRFREMLKTAYENLDVRTFEGTENLFDYLHKKGIKVVLNTGYDRKTATNLLSKLQWTQGQEFDLLVTADDVVNGRPHPDMIFHAMEKLAVTDASEVIKIGDSAIDIEEGKAAGCYLTLGVTTGAQTSEQLKKANPNYIINSLTYLEELV